MLQECLRVRKLEIKAHLFLQQRADNASVSNVKTKGNTASVDDYAFCVFVDFNYNYGTKVDGFGLIMSLQNGRVTYVTTNLTMLPVKVVEHVGLWSRDMINVGSLRS
nr:hypothetical protein [Tanacetum cinerariifolium]